MNTQGTFDHWTGGQLFTFSGIDGKTDFHWGLTLRTSFDAPGLDVKLPGTGRIRLPAPPTACTLTGDTFDATTPAGRVRGVLLDAYHLLIEGPCDVTDLGDELRAVRAGNRVLIGSRYGFDALRIDADLGASMHVRLAWLAARPAPGGLAAPARRAYAKALSQMKTMVYSAEGQVRRRFTTPDRWPHRGMWLWDSAFHAVGYRHIDPPLAREILEAVFDGQADDGFVPIRSDPERSDTHFTQPPVLALAVGEVLSVEDAPEWLERIYPRLCAYVEWDLAHRDSDGAGLVEWMIESNVNCRSGESGMDNSTRFDAATRMDATDFNSLLAHECERLAGFADRLRRPAEAARWRGRHAALCAGIEQRLWSAAHDFYVDYDLDRNAQSPVLASAGFLPLLCGAASAEHAEALRRHLHNPRTFGTPLPVASVAATDPGYAKDMWRGPVWINLNWMIARGFERYGMHDEARHIRAQTLAEIERWHSEYGTLFEFFDDRREVAPPHLHRKGRCAPEVSPFHQVFFDYGWTAALYVDLLYTHGAGA